MATKKKESKTEVKMGIVKSQQKIDIHKDDLLDQQVDQAKIHE